MDYLYSLYDALVSINVPNDKARAVVDAMERDMTTTIATKADLQLVRADLQLVKQELTMAFRAEIQAIRVELIDLAPDRRQARRQLRPASLRDIPKTGMVIPIMSIQKPCHPSSLADALFSTTQQRVLALLFGQPDRSFYASEIIGLAKAGSGAVQRELARLEESELVQVRRVGTQKHYQANPASPIFDELVGICTKTVGLAEPIRRALAPFGSRISAAFVYGSVAKQRDTARSDIDLIIVSEDLRYADLYSALESVSSMLGREINPTIYAKSELSKRIKARNAFVTRVLAQPKLWVIGSDSDLGPRKSDGPRKGAHGRAA